MKSFKKIVSLISVCSMAAAMCAATAEASPLMGLPHIYDFEDAKDGEVFNGTQIWNGTTNAGVKDLLFKDSGDAKHGKVLYLDEGSYSIRIDGQLYNSKKTFVTEKDTLLYSIQVKPMASAALYTTANTIAVKYANNGKATYFGQFEKDPDTKSAVKFSCNNYTGSGLNDYVSSDMDAWKGLATDKWYTVNVKVNYAQGTAEMLLTDENGNKLGDTVTVKMREKLSGESYAYNPQFSVVSKAMANNYKSEYEYDNIKLAKYNANGAQVIKSNSDDKALVKESNATLSLNFDQSFDVDNKFADNSKITITAADGTKFTDFTAETNDFGGVDIKLQKALKQGSEYTVSFDGGLKTVFNQNVADYSFYTAQINNVSLACKQGDNEITSIADIDKNVPVTASVNVSDIKSENVRVFAAAYDETGKLISVDTDMGKVDGSKAFNLTLNLSDAENLSGCRISSFAWDMNNAPIAKAAAILPSDK